MTTTMGMIALAMVDSNQAARQAERGLQHARFEVARTFTALGLANDELNLMLEKDQANVQACVTVAQNAIAVAEFEVPTEVDPIAAPDPAAAGPAEAPAAPLDTVEVSSPPEAPAPADPASESGSSKKSGSPFVKFRPFRDQAIEGGSALVNDDYDVEREAAARRSEVLKQAANAAESSTRRAHAGERQTARLLDRILQLATGS